MASDHRLQFHQERTYMSGMLSVTSTFRLIVTGDTELKHLERLIRILRMQQQILAEDEIEDCLSDCAWYCPPTIAQQTPGA
jgi:hypothetical protein